jgi:hypothetical protein
MAALSEFNRLILLRNGTLYTCDLDAIVRAADPRTTVEPSLRQLSNSDDKVEFFRAGKVGTRTLGECHES